MTISRRFAFRRLRFQVSFLFLVGCTHLSRRTDAEAASPITGRIEGEVLSTRPDSGAAPYVKVMLYPGNRSALTDTTGRFGFDSVPPGHYRLYFSSVWYLFASRDVDVSARRTESVRVVLTVDPVTTRVSPNGRPESATKP